MIVERIQTENSLANYSNFAKSHLSIQVSLDGLAYCIFDKDLVDVVKLKKFDFTERAKNQIQLLNYVKELFEKESILSENFVSVNISHQNNLSVLVPEKYFDPNFLADYLRYSIKILETDHIIFDSIESNKSKNVYIPFDLINQFLKEKYSNLEIHHSSSVLINALSKYFKNSIGNQLFVNLSRHNLEIVHLVNSQLNIYNNFLFYTKEDFVYYLLFTMEQLGLDPEKQIVTLIGDVEKNSPLFNIIYKYIRYINFVEVNNFSLSDEFYEMNPHIQKHNFFELLNQI
jgi:hypothetical protein